MQYRALIVDDEEPGRINLRYALADYADWVIVGECASVAAARVLLTHESVDVVFLDIQMPNESGIALARSLSLLAAPPLVVFVTAYSVHAVEAFELHALDYLLKPFDDLRLVKALERAEAMLAQRQQLNYAQALQAYTSPHVSEAVQTASPSTPATAAAPHYWQQVCVRSVGRVDLIALADVRWIESAGNYMQLHLATGCVLHRVPLSQLEKYLDPNAFMRVHRSAMVATHQLARLSTQGDGVYQLTLACGDVVPVSHRYVQALRARMQSLSLP